MFATVSQKFVGAADDAARRWAGKIFFVLIYSSRRLRKCHYGILLPVVIIFVVITSVSSSLLLPSSSSLLLLLFSPVLVIVVSLSWCQCCNLITMLLVFVHLNAIAHCPCRPSGRREIIRRKSPRKRTGMTSLKVDLCLNDSIYKKTICIYKKYF